MSTARSRSKTRCVVYHMKYRMQTAAAVGGSVNSGAVNSSPAVESATSAIVARNSGWRTILRRSPMSVCRERAGHDRDGDLLQSGRYRMSSLSGYKRRCLTSLEAISKSPSPLREVRWGIPECPVDVQAVERVQAFSLHPGGNIGARVEKRAPTGLCPSPLSLSPEGRGILR